MEAIETFTEVGATCKEAVSKKMEASMEVVKALVKVSISVLEASCRG